MKGNKDYKVPQWALGLLRRLCSHEVIEAVEGDLVEFYRLNRRAGVPKLNASLEFLIGVLGVVMRFSKQSGREVQRFSMIRNYFKVSLRNLGKNISYTIINVLGLALGIACCTVIFVIVRFETSFDDYHSKSDRIYRVNLKDESPHAWRRLNGCNYAPLAAAIREEVTGIDAASGVFCIKGYQFKVKESIHEESFAFFVDEHYPEVFDVEWLAGNSAKSLNGPNVAVVTDEFARNYFGTIENAIGQTILFANKLTLTVSGIVKKPPKNTDHPYSILISFSSLSQFIPEVLNWESISQSATYVVLSSKSNVGQLHPQLEAIASKNLTEERMKEVSFFLMPLEDNHDRNGDFNSFNYDFPLPVLILLSVIASMIALIACINFVNLATAQSLNRSREVGVRKTLGSSRSQLIAQYMIETSIITTFSMVLALLLAKGAMNFLNAQYQGTELVFNIFKDPSMLIFLVLLVFFITVLAGFYPAFVLSRYKPIDALKSRSMMGKVGGLSLRRGMVIVQFFGAQLLILVMLIILTQIDVFKSRDLGFDPKEVVRVLPPSIEERTDYRKLLEKVQGLHGVKAQTLSSGYLTGGEIMEFRPFEDLELIKNGRVLYADEGYLETYGIRLLAGENLSPFTMQGAREVLVNRTLINALGIKGPETAIGFTFTLNKVQVIIKGVVEDFFTHPMSNRVDPVVIEFDSERNLILSLKIGSESTVSTLSSLENIWIETFPDHLFKYEFMEDTLKRQYGFFTAVSSFLGTASFLAIFIGCLGLYGLVSFMAIQRQKEIGIRKVMGASVANVIRLFAKESVLLIFLSFIAAAPIAYYGGGLLLSELPDPSNPGVMVFIFTLIVSIVIGCLTVGFEAFRAARINPVDCLKEE